jgi:Cu(I)/Ag(I) efflux system membrane fusion protein
MNILLTAGIVLLIFACSSKNQTVTNGNMTDKKMDTQKISKPDHVANMPGMDSSVYYTCSMHPQVMKDMPGKCPICGMDLISVQRNNTSDAEEIKLSPLQVQLGNIHAEGINSGMLGDKIVLTATLAFDQTKITSISARVMGRIEKLYFKNTGDYVKRGDKIFDLYSEELNNAKQELIMALERKNTLDNSLFDFNRLIQSAKFKLQLWGMNEAQIEELARIKKTTPTTTFYSSASGFITMLVLKEGDYAMEGGTVMRLADLSVIWAEAQIYSSQLSQIDRSGIAQVQIPDMPGKIINGKIEFVNPEINPDTRINLVRVSIPNPGNQLKPGMPAYVFFQNPKHKMLSLPIDAVIRDGKAALVWIQTGENTYKSRMVETGMETGERIEIKSGLKAGDIIVMSGAYLINSEYIFKKGANPMQGMKM